MSKASTRKCGKILLQFYSVKNFGDDMFVKIIADRFPDYEIALLCNPLHVPTWLPENVHTQKAASWLININKKIAKTLKNNRFSQKILAINDCVIRYLRKYVDASAIITGSLYMDWPDHDEKAIDFSIDSKVERVYSISSSYKDNGGDFIIGANIGPIYHNNFIEKVEIEVARLNHICLRDYASYKLIRDKANVQYAPDVLFSLAQQNVKTDPKYIGKILISVISLQYQHLLKEQKQCYFNLIKQAIMAFGPENCCLVSFCKKEGDDVAVERIISEFDLNMRSKVAYLGYDDNPDEILSAFKSCSFVISTRFHSMILAAVFNKKMYPISYNCKIENYLSDLNFEGKYALLDRIEEARLDDILQNYSSDLGYDNSQHIKYADNQFYVLNEYLNTIRSKKE